MPGTLSFSPTHTAARDALQRFVPKAGAHYANRRNYDPGPGRHHAVSQLSPYLRHRVLTEEVVLRAVLARHAPEAAEKFIQEVFWRTYWKGWLELRPAVWQDYRSRLLHQLDRVQSEEGLRHRWQAGCTGETGLDCFDAWAKELVQTGYLHNHARMWFASIWIFTLGLPWELVDKDTAALQAITPEQISEVARKYLTRERYTRSYNLPLAEEAQP